MILTNFGEIYSKIIFLITWNKLIGDLSESNVVIQLCEAS